ncbi:7578_t:CDS:10 [Gigaspora margarita]|uniref:7578_t:CDS:1 n=1 Tax=Gigaspora margarita TaxID=4874 RepID=A0ABN7US69_GIGMA|nr:7578_t:CDS:10 [Gigaspora margarita]
MYEQILTDFLDYILYKKWSMIRVLQYIEPKTDLSGEEILLTFNKSFFSINVKDFIEEVELNRNYIEEATASADVEDATASVDVEEATATAGNTIKLILHYASNVFNLSNICTINIRNANVDEATSSAEHALDEDIICEEFAYRDRIVNRLLEDIFLELIPMIYMQTPQKSERPFKNTNQRRAIGWSHASTLFIKITGLEFRVGCGEVVGNLAFIKIVNFVMTEKNYWKLALFNLRQFLQGKGIKTHMLDQIETYGLLIYTSISSAEEKLNQAQQELDNLKNQVASIRALCFHTSLEIATNGTK